MSVLLLSCNRKKHIALSVAFGPEVRALIHSGLAERLAEKYQVSIITRHPSSAWFSDLGWKILAAPVTSQSSLLLRIRSFITKARETYFTSRGYVRWRHYLTSQQVHNQSWRSSVAQMFGKSRCSLTIVTAIESWIGWAIGNNPSWKQLFQTNEIMALIYSAYGQKATVTAEQTAKNLGVALFLIPNSWKDPLTTPGLPVIPDRLLVWDEVTRQQFLCNNPLLDSDKAVVAGSLHLCAVRKYEGFLSRTAFCKKLGLQAERPIICYTTAAPTAVQAEDKLVRELAQRLTDTALLDKPQLLVRVNPMEVGNRFECALQGIPDVAVMRPKWEFDAAIDWCAASLEDTVDWAATLEHSVLNVSISSTVTLEFLEFVKPVVNVCFDAVEVAPAESNCRFWNAPYYAHVRDLPGVTGANSFEALLSAITQNLLSPPLLTRVTNNQDASPLEKIVAEIDALMQKIKQ